LAKFKSQLLLFFFQLHQLSPRRLQLQPNNVHQFPKFQFTIFKTRVDFTNLPNTNTGLKLSFHLPFSLHQILYTFLKLHFCYSLAQQNNLLFNAFFHPIKPLGPLVNVGFITEYWPTNFLAFHNFYNNPLNKLLPNQFIPNQICLTIDNWISFLDSIHDLSIMTISKRVPTPSLSFPKYPLSSISWTFLFFILCGLILSIGNP